MREPPLEAIVFEPQNLAWSFGSAAQTTLVTGKAKIPIWNGSHVGNAFGESMGARCKAPQH